MSKNGRFRTKILSSSKRCPFLGLEIQNFLDKCNRWLLYDVAFVPAEQNL